MTGHGSPPGTVLIVGATGSVGVHAVAEAVRQGWDTRALVRNPSRAGRLDGGAVKNILEALGGRRVRIALMTAIGVTRRGSTHDWKRRGERLVRASGNAYTIVRPGWFDYNTPDQLEITLLQGDTRHAGSPADGVIARAQIARVLIASLRSQAADCLTFELVAEHGPAQSGLDPVFAALDKDSTGTADGVRDQDNMPAGAEPERVRAGLAAVRGQR